eukprot:5790019-Pleurochrysis_carterae.AAC.3
MGYASAPSSHRASRPSYPVRGQRTGLQAAEATRRPIAKGALPAEPGLLPSYPAVLSPPSALLSLKLLTSRSSACSWRCVCCSFAGLGLLQQQERRSI